MVEVTSAQLELWLASFLWPFCRISAFLMVCPLLGHEKVPRQVKIGLAALLTYVLAPALPTMPAAPIVSWVSIGIMVEQFMIGIAIGLTMRVTFAAVQAAGEMISLQMGLGFASIYAPDTGGTTMLLSRFLYMITLLMFLAMNGHLLVIKILAGTFTSLPIGSVQFNHDAWQMLASYGSTILSSGMLLALPILTALLIINLAMGILNRSAPQLTVFSVGFPVTMMAGLVLLMVLMTDLARSLERLFDSALLFLQHLLANTAV